MEKFKQWIISHKVVSIAVASVLVVGITLAIVLPLTLLNKHTFSESWTVNSAYHWHACTDEGCNETKDKAEHDFDSERKCKVCGKTEFYLEIEIEEIPIGADIRTFQAYWIVGCPDPDFLDTGYYGYEYFKYGEDGTTLIFVGTTFPTEAGRYQVKVTYDGDETYLPAEITANFIIG